MHFFGYKFPDYFMEYGPIQAGSLEEAKRHLRKILGLRRLPSGLQIWNLDDRPLARWRIA